MIQGIANLSYNYRKRFPRKEKNYPVETKTAGQDGLLSVKGVEFVPECAREVHARYVWDFGSNVFLWEHVRVQDFQSSSWLRCRTGTEKIRVTVRKLHTQHSIFAVFSASGCEVNRCAWHALKRSYLPESVSQFSRVKQIWGFFASSHCGQGMPKKLRIFFKSAKTGCDWPRISFRSFGDILDYMQEGLKWDEVIGTAHAAGKVPTVVRYFSGSWVWPRSQNGSHQTCSRRCSQKKI